MSRSEIESEIRAKRRAELRGYFVEGGLGAALFAVLAAQFLPVT
ncbi:hypothetical protein [Roseivivax sediminis]|uniref:Uncharacterized protein n=1 Tax=Roseivivax sediminis TaxID=936889 RepID=A0A1I1VYY3_9RHOB|nr:hypothetical protein [Roseivivax sediminis]SFD88187.1 hypothetical protein SAMN04515678_10429 [Roseivivax sediminis]